MYRVLFNMLIETYILYSFTYYICFKKILSIRWKKKNLVRLKKKKIILSLFSIFVDSENNYSYMKVMT